MAFPCSSASLARRHDATIRPDASRPYRCRTLEIKGKPGLGMREEPAPPARAFKEFFGIAYQPVLPNLIFAGGNPQQAEDAVSAAMAEVLQRW